MIFISLASCGNSKNIRLGTGNADGNYYRYGTVLSDLIHKETEYSTKVIPTAGSVANIHLMEQGFLDMALAQADDVKAALAEIRDNSGEHTAGFHVLSSLYIENLHLVTRASSNINTLADLRDKKISVGEENSGTRAFFEKIKNFIQFSESFQIYELSFSDSAQALINSEIDAFLCLSSVPSIFLDKLSDMQEISIISIDENTMNLITSSDSSLIQNSIPAGTYKNQMQDITTAGIPAVLLVSDKIPAEIERSVMNIIANENSILFSKDTDKKAVSEDKMFSLDINMYLSLLLAIVVIYLGLFLKKKIGFIEKFCIPVPVAGGTVIAVLTCILYTSGIAELNFDETLKDLCMMIFFTSVGFQANIRTLKNGGAGLLLFTLVTAIFIIFQNILAVGLAKIISVSSLTGLCTGSIPMTGGHGTSGAFGPILEGLGLASATTLCSASATFGLVAGSLMGGPLARYLIEKKKLHHTACLSQDPVSICIEPETEKTSSYKNAIYLLIAAIGTGTIISLLLSKTGMTFPAYIGAMISAAIIRNISEYSNKFSVPMEQINAIGDICLSLFLGIAMLTLKLWQLADLALPLIILLAGQTVLMLLFARFIIFNIMGHDYDAAVLVAGACGFGMGATPNAIANIQAITDRYLPSAKAYLLIPIVGGMFADFINSLVITFFINIV
ncbi:MAG: sodium/glutamate symporter [Spirochaetia bacterium]|nr:sodium/glutamate symporter [Spirochaetia bacterium]